MKFLALSIACLSLATSWAVAGFILNPYALGAGAPPPSTSYANTGGSGNRVGSMTVTIVGSGFVTPLQGQTELINGSLGNTFYMNTIPDGSYMEFDFGSAKVIDEIKWYQSGSQTHGTWKIEGSNGSFADVGSTFTLGGSTVQTITAINGNTTAYRYYRLTLVTGPVSAGPWLQEIEFKISA